MGIVKHKRFASIALLNSEISKGTIGTGDLCWVEDVKKIYLNGVLYAGSDLLTSDFFAGDNIKLEIDKPNAGDLTISAIDVAQEVHEHVISDVIDLPEELEKRVLKTQKINSGDGLSGGSDLKGDITLSAKIDGDSLSVGPSGLKVNVDASLASNSAIKAPSVKAVVDALALMPQPTSKITAGQGLVGGGVLYDTEIIIDFATDNDSLIVSAHGAKVNVSQNVEDLSPTRPLSSAATKAELDKKANKSVTVNAGKGLTGGGDLSSPLVINVESSNSAIVVNDSNIEYVAESNLAAGSTIKSPTVNAVVSALGLKMDNTKAAVETVLTGDITSHSHRTQSAPLVHTHKISDVVDLQNQLNLKALKTTDIVAGQGLSGGGDLSANRTFNITSDDDGILINQDSIKLNILTDLSPSSTRPPSTSAVNSSLLLKADKATSITSGDGLSGGGDLSTSRLLKVKSASDGISVTADGVLLSLATDLTIGSSTKAPSVSAVKTITDRKAESNIIVEAGPGIHGGGDLSSNIKLEVFSYTDAIDVTDDGITYTPSIDLTVGSPTKSPSTNAVISALSLKVDKSSSVVAGSGLIGGGLLQSDITMAIQSETDGILIHDDSILLNVSDTLVASTTRSPSVTAVNSGLSLKANIDSPSLTGIPLTTTPTGTVIGQIANVEYVDHKILDSIQISKALIFKGTIGSVASGASIQALPTTYAIGWLYKILTPGFYAGMEYSAGDSIVAFNLSSPISDSDWTKIEGDSEGEVVGPVSCTINNIPIFETDNGRLIKDSGVSISNVSTVGHRHVSNDISPVNLTGTDLNNAKSSGFYSFYQGNGTTGPTLNIPEPAICTMVVEYYSPDWIKQTVSPIGSDTGYCDYGVWVRTWNNASNWTSWTRTVTTNLTVTGTYVAPSVQAVNSGLALKADLANPNFTNGITMGAVSLKPNGNEIEVWAGGIKLGNLLFA